MQELRRFVRDVPDFPSPGILFRDITPLLRDAKALARTVAAFAERFEGTKLDAVAAVESRGFLFGTPLALALGVGFVPLRKPGKLPAATVSQAYELEYGASRLEMHVDALAPGERVLLLDDVLASGGTAAAGIAMIRSVGAEVAAAAFVIELGALGGRDRIAGVDVVSLLGY